MQNFKSFLINEEKSHLGHRVNDVLSGMEDVQKDMDNLGSRHLNRLAEDLVNQIRKILHSQWSPKSFKHLEKLQSIGVVLAKTIEEKGDLRELLPNVIKATQQIAGKLGVKINNLQAPEIGDIEDSDFQQTPQQPEQGQGQGMQPDQGMGQDQGMGMQPDQGMEQGQGMQPDQDISQAANDMRADLGSM